MSQVIGIAVATSAIIGAVFGITKATIGVWRAVRKLARLTDGLLGQPPDEHGRGGRPGVVERLDRIATAQRDLADAQSGLDRRLKYVEGQMRPDGGTSLRDRVDQIVASTPPPPPQHDDGAP